jgi:hypothetical protein
MITVCIVNGTATSAGNGPGVASLPDGEALALIGRGLALRGQYPPPNMQVPAAPVTPA